MNPNEPYSNVQNPSELFRSVQQSSEDFSNLQSTSKRISGVGRGKKYAGAEIPDQEIGHDFLIMEEAYTLFESQGERRSLRMIGEYCKTGELICSYDTDDKRWHITRASIEQKLAKIKALNARRAATMPQNPQHTSEPFIEPPAAPQRPPDNQRPKEEAPPQTESDSSSFSLIKKLRTRILNLRILNQGKDYVIEQMHKEREQLLTRIETSSHRVGELETQVLQLENKLLQLEAPKRQTTASETPFDHAVPYREVEDVSSSQTIDSTPSGSPHESLAHNVNTYEQSQ
jgi:hypothetical protein